MIRGEKRERGVQSPVCSAENVQLDTLQVYSPAVFSVARWSSGRRNAQDGEEVPGVVRACSVYKKSGTACWAETPGTTISLPAPWSRASSQAHSVGCLCYTYDDMSITRLLRWPLELYVLTGVLLHVRARDASSQKAHHAKRTYSAATLRSARDFR